MTLGCVTFTRPIVRFTTILLCEEEASISQILIIIDLCVLRNVSFYNPSSCFESAPFG